MGKYVHLDNETEKYLDERAIKNECGDREESYNVEIKRLLKIKGGK